MSLPPVAVGPTARHRWGMLATSVIAQGSSSMAMNGPAFLIPTLHSREGLSLVDAGTVAAAPLVGVMLTLVAWGWCVDRLGERFVLLAGLVGTVVAGGIATRMEGVLGLGGALLVAGCFSASTASASGRLVVGWFPPERRGTAMGIRQMAQPLGVAVAAVTMAVLADRHGVAVACPSRWGPVPSPPSSSRSWWSIRRARLAGQCPRRTPTGSPSCGRSTPSPCSWWSRSS